MKKAYKELQKHLKNKYVKQNQNGGYPISDSVGLWVHQCGIRMRSYHFIIIANIFGSVPYPYQEADRKKILKYLKKNKYKEFKNEFKR